MTMNSSESPTGLQEELGGIDRRLGEIQQEIAAIPHPLFPGDPDQIRFSSLRGEEKRLAAKMISIVTEAP